MRLITYMKPLLNKKYRRSKLFTEIYHFILKAPTKYVKTYNNNGKKSFLNKHKIKIAKDFLHSGKVKVIIPAYEEHQFGAIYKVLDYFNKIIGKENILVIDADSKDKTGMYIKNKGYTVIEQHKIEKLLLLDKLKNDFNVDLTKRRGKGKTLLLTAIYLNILNLIQKQNHEFILLSDADITNPTKFNHAMYLAWVASQYSENKLIDARVAQHDRNNQAVMNMMTILHNTNPLIFYYFKVIRELIWPLTGQVIRSSRLINESPNSLGYCTEMIVNFASADLMKQWNMQLAQIEIFTKCLDFKNTLSKENAMMTGISTIIYAINEILLKKGIRIIDMQQKDFLQFNNYITQIENYTEEGFVASSINLDCEPNEIIRLKLDRLLPSAHFLVNNHYIDFEKIDTFKK